MTREVGLCGLLPSDQGGLELSGGTPVKVACAVIQHLPGSRLYLSQGQGWTLFLGISGLQRRERSNQVPVTCRVLAILVVLISRLGQPLTRAFLNVLDLGNVLMAHPTVKPGPLHSVTGVGDKQADAVGCENLISGIDPNFATLILSRLDCDQNEVKSRVTDLCHLLETHSHEGGGEGFPEDDLVGGFEVLLLPTRHLLSNLEITRCDDVTGQGEEAGSQA